MRPRARAANAKEVSGPTSLDYAHTNHFAGITHRATALGIVSGNNLIATRHKNNVAIAAVCLSLEHGFDMLFSQLLSGRWYTCHKNPCRGL